MKNVKKKRLLRIRNELIRKGIDCGNLEYTSGNYTDKGEKILEKIPTITCELGEIGMIDDTLYLTIIFPKSSLSENLLNIVKKYKSVNIYPFIDFKKTLYPSKTNNLEYIKHGLINEKFFQINMGFDEKNDNNFAKFVQTLRKKLTEEKIEYINQLKDFNLLKQK